MKTFAFYLKVCCSFFACIFMLASCATYTYETESWRIAETSSDKADVVVQYVGIGLNSKDVNDRKEKAKEILELAAEKTPTKTITPRLKNAHRKVFIKEGKIIIEESGSIPNPLSWFEQTGLNIFTWFNDPINLSIIGRYIVKPVDDDSVILLATNGRVVDEDTFSSILRLNTPVAIGSDKLWNRNEPYDVTDFSNEANNHEVIIWPRAAHFFYWKLSGPAFLSALDSKGKAGVSNWQSLTPEVYSLINSIKTSTETNTVLNINVSGKVAKKNKDSKKEKQSTKNVDNKSENNK